MSIIINALLSILNSVFGPVWNGVLKNKTNTRVFRLEQLNECYEPLHSELFIIETKCEPGEKYLKNVIVPLLSNKMIYLIPETKKCLVDSIKKENEISIQLSRSLKRLNEAYVKNDSDPNNPVPSERMRELLDQPKVFEDKYKEILSDFKSLVLRDYERLSDEFQHNTMPLGNKNNVS